MANKKVSQKQKNNCRKWSWTEFLFYVCVFFMMEMMVDASVDLVRTGALTNDWHVQMLVFGWFLFGVGAAYLFMYLDRRAGRESK